MNEIRFNDTGLDESPNTIAYALLALLAVTFDIEVVVEEDYNEDVIVLRDERSGYEYIRMRCSPMWGMMIVSILNRTGEELAALTEGDEPWISNNS